MWNNEGEVTVSMLIERLNNVLNTDGDLPIWVTDSAFDSLPLLGYEVEVLEGTEDKPKRLSI